MAPSRRSPSLEEDRKLRGHFLVRQEDPVDFDHVAGENVVVGEDAATVSAPVLRLVAHRPAVDRLRDAGPLLKVCVSQGNFRAANHFSLKARSVPSSTHSGPAHSKRDSGLPLGTHWSTQRNLTTVSSSGHGSLLDFGVVPLPAYQNSIEILS